MFKTIHISKNYHNTLKPLIPSNNYYIKLGIENGNIPRISCSDTISNCLTGLANTVNIGDEYYVYKVKSNCLFTNKSIIANEYVPFAKYTKECWILEEIKPTKITKIIVKHQTSNKIVKQKIKGKYYMREIITWTYDEVKESENQRR